MKAFNIICSELGTREYISVDQSFQIKIDR